MLNSIDLNDKTYDDMITEAISQISLYSSEWTNFNISDPGITTLQNLSAFNLLQLSYINEVTEAVRRKLLKLLSIEAQETRAAKVLLEARAEEVLELPAHKKLAAGELIFETSDSVTINTWGISAVYSEYHGSFRDISYLLDRDVQMGAEIFSNDPKPDMALYLMLSGKPDAQSPILLYARTYNSEMRNPFEKDFNIQFAETSWQYYTDSGWKDAVAVDDTNAFLVSGRIRLHLGGEPAVCSQTPVAGYALRCVLKTAEYDLPPWLHSITANLFEVVEKDTKAVSFKFHGAERISFKSEMAAYGYIYVYCREKKGGPYRAYKEYEGQQQPGRYYRSAACEDGSVSIEFDKKHFGYGPGRGWGAISVVCYEEEAVLHRSLGNVYGYENQLIDIDNIEHILGQDFNLLIETADKDGIPEYSFSRPGKTDPDLLCYMVLPEPGQILITNPGLGHDCRLFLCDCAVTAGRGGNIREENRFLPVRNSAQAEFINPSAGVGGESYETVEQLRLRFVSDMKSSTSAVLASDYESIVKRTPGLCIHKVKAVFDQTNNIVRIAVKPYTQGKLPRLSALYIKYIQRYLEPRRMITTGIEILQPKYIPINVQATINVKSYFENARQEIEELLNEELDYVSSQRGFGETVRFNDIYRKIEELPCVVSVNNLSLIPQVRGDFDMLGMDIQLASHCLCYPGRIALELNAQVGTSI